MKNVAFVTTFCPHHREKTFELFSSYYRTDFFFFSLGDEWYWQTRHGVRSGNFAHKYLWGFRVGKTRITPMLPFVLLGEYDAYIKCINGRFALPVTYLMAHLKRKPFILWTGIWSRLKTPSHRVGFSLTRYFYSHADAIVVYGNHVRSYLISEGVNQDKIFVAPHAVDNNSYRPAVPVDAQVRLRQQLNIPSDQKVILFLGRMEPVKGLKYLVEAVNLLNRADVTLVLAGDGSERQRLEILVKEKRLQDRVRFAGYVSPDKTLPYYAISTVFLLPSISLSAGKELWGLVVNEAFNQGLPVIATEAVGAAAGGLVQHGINGFIVPEQDSEALARSLRSVLDDPELHDRMSQNAREIIASWDNEKMVMGFRRAIDYVTQGPN
jgi:glycosyltransferase involved in cell wall biosynthesis